MSDRIAYLCGEYPRTTDTFIQREVAALRQAGVHVQTISIRRPIARERPSPSQTAEAQTTHYLLPANPLRLLGDHVNLLVTSPVRYCRALWLALTVRAPGLRALIYQLFYFAEAGMVAALMKRERLSHLHNHAPDASGYVAMIAAEMGGFSFSLVLHGFGILSEPSRWNLREKLERCAFAICVSWYARSQAMLWTDRAHWNRFHVVHCGVDPATFSLREHDGEGAQILFVGRLDHVKGLPLLLESFSLLRARRPHARLELIGDGPQRDELETLVRALGLQDSVAFQGYKSSAEVASRLKDVDVVAMSSFAEGIPVVLMEALAAGVPAVAPNIDGIPELVRHEHSGLLFTAANADELAAALDRLLGDGELRGRLGTNGRAIVEQEFDLALEVSQLVGVIKAHMAGAVPPVRGQGNSERAMATQVNGQADRGGK
jgi:colanic acid/amylovoran biosynthesis glycosyltransferase